MALIRKCLYSDMAVPLFKLGMLSPLPNSRKEVHTKVLSFKNFPLPKIRKEGWVEVSGMVGENVGEALQVRTVDQVSRGFLGLPADKRPSI